MAKKKSGRSRRVERGPQSTRDEKIKNNQAREAEEPNIRELKDIEKQLIETGEVKRAMLKGRDYHSDPRFIIESNLVGRLGNQSPFPPGHGFIESDQSFFLNLMRAKESKDFLIFEDSIPDCPSLNHLFVRESYKSIIQQFERNRRGPRKAIVTGTPGIGKSLLLVYWLFKLVQAKKRVLFIYCSHMEYFDSVRFWTCQGPPGAWMNGFWSEDLYCLIDCKFKTPEDIQRLPIEKCNMIFSVSIKPDLIRAFGRGGHTGKLYMPIWTLEEMEKIAPYFGTRVGWEDDYWILGGIPRTVFEHRFNTWSPVVAADELVRKTLKRVKLDDILRIVDEDSMGNWDIHTLVHLKSVDPYFSATPVLASEFVADAICDQLEANGKKSRTSLSQLMNRFHIPS